MDLSSLLSNPEPEPERERERDEREDAAEDDDEAEVDELAEDEGVAATHGTLHSGILSTSNTSHSTGGLASSSSVSLASPALHSTSSSTTKPATVKKVKQPQSIPPTAPANGADALYGAAADGQQLDLDDPDLLKQAEEAAFQEFHSILGPYTARIAARTLAFRDLATLEFSKRTTESLLAAADSLTQNAGDRLTGRMREAVYSTSTDRLGMPPASNMHPSTSTPSSSSYQAGLQNGTSATDVRSTVGASADPLSASLEAAALAALEDKAERKKASARAGWEKRRANAAARGTPLSSMDPEIQLKGTMAAKRKREERKLAAAAALAAADPTGVHAPAPFDSASVDGGSSRGHTPSAPANGTSHERTSHSLGGILNGSAAHYGAPSVKQEEEISTTFVDGDVSMASAGALESYDLPRKRVSSPSSSNAEPLPSKRLRTSPGVPGPEHHLAFGATDPHALGITAEGHVREARNERMSSDFPSSPVRYARAEYNVLTPPHEQHQSIQTADRAQGYAASPAPHGVNSARKGGNLGPDYERKVWATLARSSVPKVIRVQQQGLVSRQIFHKRLAGAASREAKKYNTKHIKPPKDIQIKSRRVMREILLHLKGSEKTVRENKRRQDKEALEKVRKEEEMREAQRAARKLNFLITQTELYSHFVGSKLKTAEAEESAETAGTSTANKNGAPGAPPEARLVEALSNSNDPADAAQLSAIDFNDADESNMLSHAKRNAAAAAQLAKEKARRFDENYSREQANSKENYILDDDNEGTSGAGTPNPGDAAMDSLTAKANAGQMSSINIDDMNFQNPTMAGDVDIVQQPSMLTCELKEYQLKGLNWLANLYEQGINGILADEMGLGKTVQSISLMAYLAEQHNIWGPFLVVAPASTLHNWQQEISRFAPALKVLPYWGNVKDRTTLRKFWNRKSLRYDRNAPFHVLVTSYQLVVTDEQYFNKVKWQYMILDEAQAIKSSSSSRWRILLGMNCRNRLLLTGTPIQNSMQELWALLHFIMPSLFDSHNEFSDWFAKDIEGNADKNGAMNEHQLRRLHMILKPFMLRRIKKNVQNELAEKVEIDVYCDLTTRQRHMYRTLRQNISITDLVARASTLGDDESVKRLMNLIMQFRKVCNHPELFERADVTAPFSFSDFNQSYGLNREGNSLAVQYSSNSYLDVRLPKLLHLDPVGSRLKDTDHVGQLMNVWSKRHIARRLRDQDSTFGFSKLADLDINSLHTLARSDDPVKRLEVAKYDVHRSQIAAAQADISATSCGSSRFRLSHCIPYDPHWRYLGLPPLNAVQDEFRQYSRYHHSDIRFYIDEATAPPPQISCSSRDFAYKHTDKMNDLPTRTALYGIPGESTGIIGALDKSQLPLAPMEVPQLHKLILDSGKLAKLDELLAQLKAGGHRVLVYFQMTRMIDLMEEYLAFRQYKYLRLDGSSSISDRRDMVADWQSKPELFIFLLSTRAGGLGINLTAADTVIFYDSDWNPSNDAQAMDRAHRLGQTRQVTVYRLITKNTIDERILALARTKKSVQDAVVGSSTQVVGGAVSASGEVKSNEVVSLLLDDEELAESMRQSEIKKQKQDLKMIDNGRKGARAREENKKARSIAASAQRDSFASGSGSMLGAGQGWGAQDDDDDAFGFFSGGNAKRKNEENGDEDAEDADGFDGSEAGQTNNGKIGKAGGKGKAGATNRGKKADGEGPPKKRRAPNRKGTEQGSGPQGVAKKPSKKASAKTEDGDTSAAAEFLG